MTKKITFNKLTEEMIRETRHPFNVNDFTKNLENRWQKQISESTLKKVKKIHLEGQGDKIDLCKNCDPLYRANLSWWAN